MMESSTNVEDVMLRRIHQENGHRFTDQRAAVFRLVSRSRVHPTAEDVFLSVRTEVPGISLATVYKSLETLVGCGLAVKLTYSDGSARYDGRTDPHHHARCLACGRVVDIEGQVADSEVEGLKARAGGFTVTGFRLELSGYCATCVPEGGPDPIRA